MKKILVTGGAGFIGSHLCKRLLALGNEVICLDNLFTGNKANIYDLLDNKRFEFIRHDVIESIILEVDEIYNLACPASPVHYQKNPVQTVNTSVMGAINMLNLATSHHARILQTSTSEVYGDPLVHPQKEDYWGNVNPIGVRSCYDEGKRVAETLFCDYHRQYDTDIRIVRLFNTYGPHMCIDDDRVVSNFIVQALRGDDITIYGDGTQTRSFCYVDDIVNALIKTMETDTTGPINLGNPTEISVDKLAQLILTLTGSTSKLVYKELPSDDPIRRKPDISLAKEILDWEPSTTLQIGLTKTINYFDEILSER